MLDASFHAQHTSSRATESHEQELGYSLEWEEFPTRCNCRISLYLNNIDPEDEKDWPRQHGWLTAKLNDMHRVLVGRVRALNATDWKADGDTSENRT
jgi:xanthine/CO dehydrogenase XdhC/CoxF family maturation factor